MFIKPKKKGWISGPAAFYKAAAGGGGGVTFDAISNGTPVSSGTGISWTHTPVGTPTGVIVLIGGFNAGSFVSACTYGGVNMTEDALRNPAGLSRDNTIVFALANPPAGPQTVSATGASGAYLAGAAITVLGSDLVTCLRSIANNDGTAASSTVTVTSVATDLVIDCAAGFQAAGAASGPGGAQTSRYTAFWNGNLAFGVSTSPGAASVTPTWSTVNSGSANTWSATGVSVKHA